MMDVLQAVRWAIQAWFDDITEAAICNCWIKARILASENHVWLGQWPAKRRLDGLYFEHRDERLPLHSA
jgi:hypothetical protein